VGMGDQEPRSAEHRNVYGAAPRAQAFLATRLSRHTWVAQAAPGITG